MKKCLFILLMLVFTTFAGFAQTMCGYEYWFDNDYEGRTTTISSQQQLSLSLDIEGINSGLHYLNFRAQGSDGKWGCLSRYIVYVNNHANHLSRVDYWLDGKIDDKKSQGVNGNSVLISVDISQMERGKHTLAFQGFTERGSFAMLDSLEFDAIDAPIAPMPVISYEGNIISISIADPTATTLPVFYYTLDGTDPDTTSTKYEGPFEVTHNCVVKSIGILEGAKNSPVDSLIVDWFKVANVEFVQNGSQILMSTLTDSTTIHYLLSTDPTNEFVYSAPVTMIDNCTIEAYATRSGYLNSDTTSFVFHADLVTVADPLITRMENSNSISITTSTDGATIYYTLDGSVPDSTSAVYSQPFEVMQNLTVKAVAMRANYFPSQVMTFAVDWFKVANVDFVQSGNQVSLSTTTADATIHYWLSNSEAGEQIYNAPVTMSGDCTLSAYATRSGYLNSDTTSFVFHAGVVTCSNPVIVRQGTTNSVSIMTSTDGATIYYTLDGSVPDSTSAVYSQPFEVAYNQTVKAVAMRANYFPSQVTTFAVDWFKVSNVEFAQDGNQISLSTTTADATIHYWLSNSEAGEQIYNAPVTMSDDCTLSAYATRSGYLNSDTTNFVFVVGPVTVAAPIIMRLDNSKIISMSTTTEDAVIHYTLDGSVPDSTSTIYSQPFEVTQNLTIKAIAMRENYYPSQVTTFVVDWFKVAIPTLVWNADTLIVSSATEGATIDVIKRFTSDGDVAEWAGGVTPMRVELENLYYEIWARKEGWTNSDTLKFYYPYTAWHELLAAVEHARQTIEAANQSDKVVKVGDCPYAALNAKLTDAEGWYAERNSEAADINDLRNQILQLIAEVEAELNAVDYVYDADNGVLAINGGTTLAEALDAAGGRDEVAKTITAIVWNSTATLTNSDLQGLDNPNMLVYVQSASQAPANRDNVVIGNDSTGYTAKNIKLTDVTEGNGDFYSPIAFTAEMISYTHEYRQQTEVGVSRGWETIAMPFTVQTIMHETKGLITPFGTDSINKHFWLRQLTQQGLAQARQIEANTPYLISMPNSAAYSAEFNLNGLVTFSSQNVEVPVTQLNVVEAQTATGDMVMLQPNFKGQSATAMIYALNVGVERDGHPEGSVFEANKRSVRPFEAFTVHHGNGPAPQFISISEMNGDVTGIEDVRCKMSDGRGDNWYDLNGRKLQQKPTQKGVYLNNGRKVVVVH